MRNESNYLVKSYLVLFSKFFLVGIFLLFQLNVCAQQKSVSGTVTGTDGAPLAGVTVLVKGTTVGTLTDINGKFTIPASSGQTLVFSFMGMATVETAIGDGNVYNVTLSESLVGLEEVIVIGYGTAKKADLTGSVVRVETESFQNSNIRQITEMLTGTVAGFSSNQGTKAAGGGDLEIRGPTSLSADTDPLIVLDGVIFNGSLSDINPNDLASIDILKDASSAAVFGSKAANGVILITTNKGSVGKPVINFTAKAGVSKLINYDMRPFGGNDYLKFRRDFMRTRNYPQPDYYWFSPEELPAGVTIEQWRSAGGNPQADNMQEWYTRMNLFPIEKEIAALGSDYYLDWMDLCFQNGLNQDYDLSMSGGTQDVRYYWSIGYLNNQGIIVGDKFSTIRSRLNLDGDITNWLKVGINSQFSLRDESTVEANLSYLGQMTPLSEMWNKDGTIKWFPNDYTISYNPLLNYHGQDRLRKLNNLFASIFAEVKLPFGFSFRSSFQPRFGNTKDYNFWDTNTTVGSMDYADGFGRRTDQSSIGWMIDNLLMWNKQFGVHRFDLTLLQNAEKSLSYSSVSESATFLPTEALGFYGMAFGTLPANSSSDTKATGTALMARMNYTLLDKYLITASIRKDGFSAFGQENPTAYFPAMAFAWRISDEEFFSGIKDVMNRMKIRLSWGVNGNRDIGIYAALSQLAANQYFDGSTTLIGTFANTLANTSLRWERSASTNVGLDIGLLNDRIDIVIDAYNSHTTDLLMTRQLPRITGFNSVMSNLGKLQNRGLELTINTNNLTTNNLNWRSNLVFSFNRNKILELFGNVSTYTLLNKEFTGDVPDFTNLWFVGQSLDIVWDYDVTGIWQNDEADEAAVYLLKPGGLKSDDVNKDGKYTAVHDKKFLGHSTPLYRLGFRNDFTFLKHFTASLFIRADLGHIGNVPNVNIGTSTLDRHSWWSRPYWTPTDPNNEWPSLGHIYDSYAGGIGFWKSKSFVRIQDFSLSYNLPATVVSKMKMNNARVFISSRNLATFTKWPGWDPETTGTNISNWPMPKSFTIGISLSL